MEIIHEKYTNKHDLSSNYNFKFVCLMALIKLAADRKILPDPSFGGQQPNHCHRFITEYSFSWERGHN